MEIAVDPEHLRSARLAARLTQQEAAKELGVSQAYLALIEQGRRPVTARLLPRLAKFYDLGPTALPLDPNLPRDSASLATAVARLGYPAFPRSRRHRQNPASVLLAAITAADLEVRVLEALPWLAVEYSDLDWNWLIRETKVRDLQNRLGFLVSIAQRVAATQRNHAAAEQLHKVETMLDRARLVREDTLCQDSLSDAERRWLRTARSAEARHWNLLTDLTTEHLPYAA
jgi:transcriptional regulator with XRE-family HTH domain